MGLKRIVVWLAALLGVYLLLFHGMSDRGLVGPDEPRYASIAREMSRSGDWTTPRLAGEPWFEKPALLYWLGAATASLGMGDDRATRFPVAVLSALFLLFFYRALATHFGDAAARYATLVLATSAGWVAFSQIGGFDLPLTAALGTALLCLLPWVEHSDETNAQAIARFWRVAGTIDSRQGSGRARAGVPGSAERRSRPRAPFGCG